MENLIQNSVWAPGPSGGPLYFTGFGAITYDSTVINGYRTCSITNFPPMTAQDFYDLPIDVRMRIGITWGFTIRAIAADSISLIAEFFDANMRMIQTMEQPITSLVNTEFQPVSIRFLVPQGAAAVRLSIRFSGRITACTFYAPIANYS